MINPFYASSPWKCSVICQLYIICTKHTLPISNDNISESNGLIVIIYGSFSKGHFKIFINSI